jgi:hypothetical protein
MANSARDLTVQCIEDSTAVLLDGQDSLRELWLFLRAQERRGRIDPDDAQQAQYDLARVRRAVEEGLRLARAQRGEV